MKRREGVFDLPIDQYKILANFRVETKLHPTVSKLYPYLFTSINFHVKLRFKIL